MAPSVVQSAGSEQQDTDEDDEAEELDEDAQAFMQYNAADELQQLHSLSQQPQEGTGSEPLHSSSSSSHSSSADTAGGGHGGGSCGSSIVASSAEEAAVGSTL